MEVNDEDDERIFQDDGTVTTAVEAAAVNAVNATEEDKKWTCEFCDASLSTKQALDRHIAKGICLGKGYICLRCLRLWPTMSELNRHQASIKKCRKRRKCVLRRTSANDTVHATYIR